VKPYEVALAALGEPTRRTIFERLAARPRAVGELAEELPVSRPAVSQHLRVLREAGLVAEEPVGTRRVYRVDPSGVAAVRAYFESFWDALLADVKAEAEAQERRKG
jgi:DNA-binding transcriptional ArsR family regulator